MKQQNSTPPKFADWLLQHLLSDEIQEEIIGDLHEYYKQIIYKSKWKRTPLYWIQVFNFLRPFALKNNSQLFNINRQLIRNQIVTSIRIIRKHHVFSFVNVFGLAISMAIGILMILFLSEIYSFDDFHSKKDQIYRVNTQRVQGAKGKKVNLTTASYFVAEQMKENTPGVEEVVIIDAIPINSDINTGEKVIPIHGYTVSESFFELFTFPLSKGDFHTALSHPDNIVLTETISKELFGENEPMGQKVFLSDKSEERSFIVSGIVSDPPGNSHIQFEVLLSRQNQYTTEQNGSENVRNPNATGDYFVYLLLDEYSNKDHVEAAIKQSIAAHNASIEHPIDHLLQPISNIVRSDIFYNITGPRFPQKRIYIFLVLTILILFSACINYSNLSLARAIRRSKEVGIRKVIGASRSQVFGQFITEAIIFGMFAFILAIGFYYFLKPSFINFLSISTQGYDSFSLRIEAIHIIYFFLFVLMMGILAGFLPAFLLSGSKTTTLFSDISKINLGSGIQLRKVLVIFQYVMSISLIMTAVLFNNQYKFTLNYDLGYETENIINIPVIDDNLLVLENEFGQIEGVSEMTKSSMVLGVGGDGLMMGMLQAEGQNKPTPTQLCYIDNNFIKLHDFEILAESDQFFQLKEDHSNIILNEGLLRQLELGTPKEAIGKSIYFNGQPVTVTGIVKDFIGINLTKRIFDGFAMVPTGHYDQFKSLAVKVKNYNIDRTIDNLRNIYEELDPHHPFHYNFYSEQIAQNYANHKMIYKLISILALIAIVISMLGMIGMAIFTTQSRIREISIRKILGANLSGLLILLSRGFLLLIIISGLISIPITLYLFDHMILNEFLDHAKIGIFEIMSGFMAVLILGILIIVWQVKSAIRFNPAEVLQMK